jgi:hypothetical protein
VRERFIQKLVVIIALIATSFMLVSDSKVLYSDVGVWSARLSHTDGKGLVM